MRNIRSSIVFALVAATSQPNQVWANTTPAPDQSDAAMIAAGEKRFNQNCVYCHGNAGSGGKGAPLQGRDDMTSQYLFDTISNGKKRGALLMPGWKEAFSEKEIRELAAYIRSLRDISPKK